MSVIRSLLLGVVYFLVVTPVGWACRLIHDPLTRQLDHQAKSYWVMPAKR